MCGVFHPLDTIYPPSYASVSYHRVLISTDPTEFPAPQKARLLELIPDYEQFISKENPDDRPRCKDLTKWQKKKAKELMEESLFIDLVKAEVLVVLTKNT